MFNNKKIERKLSPEAIQEVFEERCSVGEDRVQGVSPIRQDDNFKPFTSYVLVESQPQRDPSKRFHTILCNVTWNKLHYLWLFIIIFGTFVGHLG